MFAKKELNSTLGWWNSFFFFFTGSVLKSWSQLLSTLQWRHEIVHPVYPKISVCLHFIRNYMNIVLLNKWQQNYYNGQKCKCAVSFWLERTIRLLVKPVIWKKAEKHHGRTVGLNFLSLNNKEKQLHPCINALFSLFRVKGLKMQERERKMNVR